MKIEAPPVPKFLKRRFKLIQFIHNLFYKKKPFKSIELIYKFLDKYNRDYISTFTVCRGKGCSYCCENEVWISTLEAAYISLKTGIEYNKGTDFTTYHRDKCPFLKDDACSIYPYRPFNCRVLHAVESPEKCKNDESQLVYGLMISGYNNDRYLICFYNAIQGFNNDLPYRDIRDFFGKI